MGRNQKKPKQSDRSGGKPITPCPTTEDSEGHIYFVADTSALISNYHGLVSNLKSAPECTDWKSGERLKPVVVIPWIVLCEMDKLKEYKYRTSLIVDHLLEFQFDPLFRFETLREFKDAQKWGRLLSLDSNDDKVLQTCLSFGQLLNARKDRGSVILLTDDHMLKLRAQVIGIRALGSGEVPNSNVELLTAYCESMILAPVFKEQVLKSLPTKNSGKKRVKSKSKKSKNKANGKNMSEGTEKCNNRGKEACRNIYNAVQVALHHITPETHEGSLYSPPGNSGRRGSRGQKKYNTWVPSFRQLLGETGLLKKVLGNSSAQWYEWCSGRVERISDFLVLACLGRLYEHSLLACVHDGEAVPTRQEDFTTFGTLLLEAYFHDGCPKDQPIEGLMQDVQTMQKLFSTPQDWYTWNGDCVCGPYLSESILELAASKCLTKDSKLIGVEVGGKPPVTEGEFKTYAQFLVEMYCSGRVDAKNTGKHSKDCAQVVTSTPEDPEPQKSGKVAVVEPSFHLLMANLKLVQSALGASAYWYSLFEWGGETNICGPYRGGEILHLVLDYQVPANFKLHGTGEGELVPLNEREFKTFQSVLLDAHQRWVQCV